MCCCFVWASELCLALCRVSAWIHLSVTAVSLTRWTRTSTLTTPDYCLTKWLINFPKRLQIDFCYHCTFSTLKRMMHPFYMKKNIWHQHNFVFSNLVHLSALDNCADIIHCIDVGLTTNKIHESSFFFFSVLTFFSTNTHVPISTFKVTPEYEHVFDNDKDQWYQTNIQQRLQGERWEELNCEYVFLWSCNTKTKNYLSGKDSF